MKEFKVKTSKAWKNRGFLDFTVREDCWENARLEVLRVLNEFRESSGMRLLDKLPPNTEITRGI